MRAVVAHVEATAEPCMLIRIDPTHALDYPQRRCIEDGAEFTNAVYVLGLIEFLESPLCCTCELGGYDVERCEALFFDPTMDPVNYRTPAENNGGPQITSFGARSSLKQVLILVLVR